MSVNNGVEEVMAAGKQTETSVPVERIEVESVKEKRRIKLTPKALLEKLEALQKTRTTKVKKANNLMVIIKDFMLNREYEKEVQCSFGKFIRLCDEAREVHNSVMVLLPNDEQEKQQTWFNGKMLIFSGFKDDVQKWLNTESQVSRSGVDGDAFQEDIQPNDSVSNISSRGSSKPSSGKGSSSVRTGRSSASSARIIAEAEKAALIARATALKEKHALEVQQEQLRRRQEQMDIDAEIAAATAKIAVLNNSDNQHPKTLSDGMNAYYDTGTTRSGKEVTLNPHVEEYKPRNVIQQTHSALQSDLHSVSQMQTSSVIQNSNGTSTSNIYSIMQKQNEITALLVQQHQASTLPQRDINVFDGNPLQYRTFIRAFEHGIEDKTSNYRDRLYFLEQYTQGQPKELVRSCQHMDPQRGYVQAKALLKEHFGNEFKIATAYIEKVLGWPSVKSEDVSSLHSYALFLRGCCNAMEEIEYMKELEMPSNLKIVIMKLPYKLRENWRTVACELMERHNRRAQFRDIVTFVERQVKMSSDPFFGDIQSTQTVQQKPQPRNTIRNSFATTVVTNNKSSQCCVSDFRSNSQVICLYCKRDHLLEQCTQMQSKMHNEKLNFLKEKGICFGCLCVGHMSRDCDKRLTCTICAQRHPSILHIQQKERECTQGQDLPPLGNAFVQSALQAYGQTGAGDGECALSIVPVKVKSCKGQKVIQTYAFLDPGSSATFCSEHLMHRLKLKGRKTNILLKTMGDQRSVSSSILTGLEVSSLYDDIFYSLPEVFTQEKMPVSKENIVTEGDLHRWPYLKGVKIPQIPADVDLLIGANASKVMEPWEVKNSDGEGPYAVRTLLGWVVNGPLQGRKDNGSTSERTNITVNRISVDKLEEMLNKQYNHDFNEIASETKEMSREDHAFMEKVNGSIKLQDGHYKLNLPFKKENPMLPNNLCVAKQRLVGLKRKLDRNKTFHQEYSTFLDEVISQGYAERVPLHQLKQDKGKVWYIPHHGVYHPKKGTLRVVFDCGAAFKGTSLNDQLLQGPCLTNSLLGVLVRFRQEPIAFMADVKAMFHQVKVATEDTNFLRFLWWPDGDLKREPVEYRMNVHLFGAVSSPSCACFALRRTAEDNKFNFPEKVIDTIHANFYMDDCLKSVASEEEAILMIKDLTAVCLTGGFQLTKWVSNSRSVLQTVPEEHRAHGIKMMDLDQDQLPVERALGLLWCVQSDTFKFKMNIKDNPCTRRGVLSIVCSVYDPLGFLAPFTLTAKLLLQELCRTRCGWDDPLPSNLQKQWSLWLKELERIADFEVNRCLKPTGLDQLTNIQLHHFSDASTLGFGTVTYLRMETNKDVHVHFLLGKSRVAPLKHVTIPRLELTAAVLAARVDKMLRAELQFPLVESVFWTDSTSVLKYIKNEDKRFLTFVANRISFIREVTRPSQWRYISTSQNPADCCSRGMKADQLLSSEEWISGPHFLWKPQEEWQVQIVDSTLKVNDPEVKRNMIVNTIGVNEVSSATNATHRLIVHFSDWLKLKVAVAWFLKLKKVLRQRSQRRKEIKTSLDSLGVLPSSKKLENELQTLTFSTTTRNLTLEDLIEAESAIVAFSQQQQFGKEIAALSASSELRVKRDSKLYKLDPVFQDGLIRVGGRLRNAAMPEERKHPIILYKDQHCATLILRHIHQQLGHSGRNHMLSKLRKKYWIIKGNAAARKIISNCGHCRRHGVKAGEQKMADLPKERLIPDLPPFTNVGVDYFGPVEVKRGRSMVKRYGVIFTCMASRAIHLEVAYSLDTDACINSLRRFICRRGQVVQIRSDNGTNFIGAERELRESLNSWNKSQIQKAMLQEGVQWSFNPPGGSHYGGVWERMIKMVKKILSSILHQQTLDDEGFHTVLCEIEAILNDRPITKLSDDPNDLEPLTPNHLLQMKGKPVLPPGLFDQSELYSRRRWKQVQYMCDLFWRRWTNEYLPLLQERQKWNKERRSFAPGDIVVIVDSTAPRGSWLMGRVLEVFPDKNGLVRSVRVQTKTSVLERPVTKLCLLYSLEK